MVQIRSPKEYQYQFFKFLCELTSRSIWVRNELLLQMPKSN